MKRRRKRKPSKKTIIVSAIGGVIITVLIILMLSMIVHAVKYSEAKRLAKQQKYEKAYETYIELGETEKTKENLKQTGVDYAEHLMEDKDFESAIEVLSEIEEDELLQQCYYESAKAFAKQKEYGLAVSWYERIENEDVTDELLATKYAFVKCEENRNNTNYTTCRYLKELKAADYKDSAKIYEELYAWKATIIANKDKNDQKTQMKSLEKGDVVSFHIQLSGGEPREEVSLSYEILDEKGKKTTGEWSRVSCNGAECWKYIEYDSADVSGKVTLTIYNQNKDVLSELSINFKK